MARSARRQGDATKKQVVVKKKEETQEKVMVEEDANEEQVRQATISSSSSSASDSGEESDSSTKDKAQRSTGDYDTEVSSTKGYSRLFSPYRTLGIVAQGPFYLLPNQNSSNAVLCTAIGDRFHLLQCDRLHPVLVSQAVPSVAPGPSGTQHIQHIISDNSLSVTLVSHGPKGNPLHVTMFQRTQPVATLRDVLPSKEWSIVHLMHLGTIKITIGSGEKKGMKENAALCGIVLSREQPIPDDGVPVVGNDDMSSDSDSSSDSGSDDDHSEKSRGQVVLCVASRTSLVFHKRIDLDMFPTFSPRVALHPPTYVNKIVIGGSCSKSGKDAMILLNVRTGQLIHRFKCLDAVALRSKNAKSEVSCLEASPAIDTIAVGNSKGSVHLVNTRMDILLFSLSHSSKSGAPTRITSMSFRTDGAAMHYGIAPLAVGRSDGTISVWDLTPPEVDSDEESPPSGRTLLCEMERAHYPGGVHKLQYMPQEPLLVSTGTHSNCVTMHIFDNPDHAGRILKERKGHTSAPNCIRYLHPGAGAGGGILVNAADGTDAAACTILSAGSSDRTLRVFSTARSVLDKEYSQGKGLVKRARELGMESKIDLLLPPTTAMASSEARSRDWGDLVTIHKDHSFAYVWSSRRGAQSGPVLRQNDWNVSAMKKSPPHTTHATSVALSTCGNFALVGTKGGIIYKYNVQSGNERGTFPFEDKVKKEEGRREVGDIRRTFKALEKSMKVSNTASNLDKQDVDQVLQAHLKRRRDAKVKSACHVGFAVTGIAVDGVNKTLVSVGADAKLIMWNFKTHAPHQKCPVTLPAPATKLCHIRDSDLAAVALADFTILMFDCSSLTTVRRFGAGSKQVSHSGTISDLGFSPDGRTLYSSSLDGTIRVWDVPTNSCVDWLGFKTPPTSLTVSPTGEFLATTHTGKLGISLWSDRSFYQTIHVDGSASPAAPSSMDDPAPVAEVENKDDDHDNAMKRVLTATRREENADTEEDIQISDGPIRAKEDGLLTMSGLPPAHWKNLFHLDLVKQRNKPREPPKKPPSAPFFLQWRPGETLDGVPVLNPETAKGETQNQEEWDAVWSDDDNEDHETTIPGIAAPKTDLKRSRDTYGNSQVAKKPKISHHRSHLAGLLQQCSDRLVPSEEQFAVVTQHIGTLGPSAIDISFSSLCNGMHDLDDGLPLLTLACQWLLEACRSRERFDAVNAYLHRFLYLHSSVLAGIHDQFEGKTGDTPQDKTPEELEQLQIEQERRQVLLDCVEKLRESQTAASNALQGKIQNTLCLLRHFSRMI
jgi:U3 small nucleolar RNA-associated protein 21